MPLLLCKLTSPFSSPFLPISKFTKFFFSVFSGTNTVACQPLHKTWLLSRTTTVHQFLLLKQYDFYNSEMHFPLFFCYYNFIQVFFFLLMGKPFVHIFMLMLHVARPGFPWEDARSSMPASRQCWKSGREQGRKQGKNGRFLRDVRVAFARQSVAWGLWVGIFVQPRQDGYEDEIVQSLNPLKWSRYFWELYNMSSAALIFKREHSMPRF